MRARAAAQEALREALGIFVGLGAATWAERVRSMLARIGVRGDDGVTLTARELEVARLVAQGFTNREIAERVFLAEKTVEGKLSRIYQKLSVQSRAELATWLARADRSPAPNQG